MLRLAFVTFCLNSASRGNELIVDSAIDNLEVDSTQTVWFDSANTNAPIPLNTINGDIPATGILPGWAHTRWTFMKYDGANIVEVPGGEKVVGQINLNSAGPGSLYADNTAATTLLSNQSIGLLETTRDFLLGNGVSLDIAMGGLIFHNNSHWLRRVDMGGGITAFLTSSSGRLVVITNGGQADYQINGVVIHDPNAETPLAFTKTGPDNFALNAANTYTGGTRIHNGRLRADHSGAYGAASSQVVVTGENSQAFLNGGGTYNYNFHIEGYGWTEGGNKLGALRLGNNTVTGSVTLTGPARIGAAGGVTGTLAGALIGDDDLEFNASAPETLNGIINLNGSAADYTGAATVSRGLLNINNDFGGNLTVFPGALLGGSGTIAGDLVIGDDFTPSGFWVDGTAPQALTVEGEVNLSGTTNVTGTAPASGTFTLFNYGTLNGDPVTNLVPSGFRNATISDDPANSRVILSFTPSDLVWAGYPEEEEEEGYNGNVWETGGAENFVDPGDNPTNFLSGDSVTFNDESWQTDVSLPGPVAPGGVTFDNNFDYFVTGAGGILGSTGIVKKGFAAVLLGGSASNFTGPVSIEEGVLRVGSTQALGFTSGITVAGGEEGVGAQFDLNGQNLVSAGRHYSFTIEGNGPDGLGAITNSGAGSPNEGSGIRNITLTGDASVGGNGSGTIGRYDIGFTGGVQGTITGNGHTLTKVGTNRMGFRGDAGGSPIHFVIEQGDVWGENNDNAWGGTTGTLTIKDGARAGTYGPRTIATPVTIESGGTLFNEGGGGPATWTGPISVSGDVNLDAPGQTLTLTGPVSGTANVTKHGTNTVTVAQPGWTGNTTVTAGTLSLGQPSLDDDSAVSISSTAVLDLNFSGMDTIASLTIGEELLPDGLYNSSHPVHGARFTGTGSLLIGEAPPAGSYDTWAEQITNDLRGFGEDADGDGILNGLEYVLNGDPNSSDTGILPVLDSSGAQAVFTFLINDDSLADTVQTVQYGSDLEGWTDVSVHPEPAANVSVVPEGGGSRVTVTLDKITPKMFVRLKVAQP